LKGKIVARDNFIKGLKRELEELRGNDNVGELKELIHQSTEQLTEKINLLIDSLLMDGTDDEQSI
jgi:hypothetical protein